MGAPMAPRPMNPIFIGGILSAGEEKRIQKLRMRMQKLETGDGGFLHSAFAFCVLSFRPFPSRPSGSRCREREVASAIGPRRHAHSPAPRGLGPRWARY